MEYVNWCLTNWDKIALVLTGLVTVASTIAAITKTETDNKWVGRFKKLVDVLAINVGKAKRAK